MLRVVIDTNIIISALNFGGKPKDVLELARKKQVQNVISPFLLNEVENVLLKKFNWQKDITQETLKDLKKFSVFVNPPETISAISYEPDNRILECAVAGRADFIISGDHHLTDLKTYRKIKIVNPVEFLAIYSPQ
jgi:putative PIN family toxin of toxin-antitoxin system